MGETRSRRSKKVQSRHFVPWVTCNIFAPFVSYQWPHKSFSTDSASDLSTMNWTGGQLHRSARQGTLSKTQKQNFAKSRQLAVDRASRQPSPFRGFSNLNKHDEEQNVCEDDRGEQAVVAAGHIQSVLNKSMLLPLITFSKALVLTSL